MTTKKGKRSEIMQVEFICPKCKNHLAWAQKSASMSCPKCGTWVNEKNRLSPPTEILMPIDSDQLVLF